MATVKSRENLRIDLRAVAFQEGEWWIAHCLELDLAAEGKSSADALRDLLDLVDTQIQTAVDSGRLESVFRPAPPQIWAMFSEAADVPLPGKKNLHRLVERFEARKLSLA